jgi:predicted N-formylglutamate amidohydrolase
MTLASLAPPLSSLPGIVDFELVRGGEAGDRPADLLLEVPHGATATSDFTALAARLTSPLPTALVDFFHVNTDAGAPELALATARAFVAAEPRRAALVARCRIPRTFIDCNRRIDAAPEQFRAGKVTPGLMPWITTAEDRALLRAAYGHYVAAIAAAVAALSHERALVQVHSYAPRTVNVEVDLHIVENLRRAYQPDVEPTWELRPAVEIIARDHDGVDHAPAAVVAALRRGLAERGLALADSTTYPLHPSTLAWQHTQDHPGRALCIEVRRDLVADPFEPFAEMRISAAKVAPLAEALAAALRAWW